MMKTTDGTNNGTARPSFFSPRHLLHNPETTILDLYDWNATHNAHAPLLRYTLDGNVRDLCWSEVNAASHRAAAILQQQAGRFEAERPVLAVFANIGTHTILLV